MTVLVIKYGQGAGRDQWRTWAQHGAAGSEDVERTEPFSESKCSQFAPLRAQARGCRPGLSAGGQIPLGACAASRRCSRAHCAGCGQEKAVLEPRREVAPRAGEVRVDGVLRAARRRRMVPLVEDQHRAWSEAPEPVAEVGYPMALAASGFMKPARGASVWSLGSVMPTSWQRWLRSLSSTLCAGDGCVTFVSHTLVTTIRKRGGPFSGGSPHPRRTGALVRSAHRP
jgi:hypothetical protein